MGPTITIEFGELINRRFGLYLRYVCLSCKSITNSEFRSTDIRRICDTVQLAIECAIDFKPLRHNHQVVHSFYKLISCNKKG